LSEKLLYKEFTAGQIIVVDTEPDPDNEGQLRIAFSAVDGFVPPASVELATTSTAPEITPGPADEPASDGAAQAD
jgi:ATP-dependent Clp protease ATP-binding subunit ClpC